MNSIPEIESTPPYSKLANHYDGMMEHVDYQTWADYIHNVFIRYGRDIHDVCEVACGTGTLAVALARMGYRMQCSDISESMIVFARTKAERLRVDIQFAVQDMRALIVEKPMDAVLCMYDSVNYIQSMEENEKLLHRVRTVLRSGGIFVFDVCTQKNSIDNFDNRYEFDKGHGYRRRSRYDAENQLQYNEIHISDGDRAYHEAHCQKIYPLSDWLTAIQRSPFKLLGMFENLTFEVGSERSERVHFVLTTRDDL